MSHGERRPAQHQCSNCDEPTGVRLSPNSGPAGPASTGHEDDPLDAFIVATGLTGCGDVRQVAFETSCTPSQHVTTGFVAPRDRQPSWTQESVR
jgi:hypothetical protein